MIASGIPVRMLREKYHQCGRRSSATVSPSWIRFGVRHGSVRQRDRRDMPLRSSRPAELVEALVGHAEVVADLVQHGDPHLRRELVVVAGERATGRGRS